MTVGMQNSGRASRDQAVERVSMCITTTRRNGKGRGKLHTNSDDVADSTKMAKIELALADLLPSAEQADGDGGSIGSRQANDTNTREGVESGSGTKVDDSEDDLHNHAEHHGVEGHVELLVDLDPPLGARDGTVTSKGPGAARRGSGAANAAHDGEDHDGEEKTNGTARRSNGGLDDGGHGLSGDKFGELLQIGNDKDERDEEEEASNGVDEDGGYHGLGDLGGRILDFLTHANHRLLVKLTR